ncbi:hypothetical protein BJ875DRAFT_17088 [Amylocarpus encephaloides]|uniref:Uncharacterized protein n=1 Tax=Amylocarpus encephaloides TaxID=45428 RepID=A0A9P7YJT4_9HELO|nr:hypothetical protein BJ875DRAFT_17088 [Amylocarpus encephaloides]
MYLSIAPSNVYSLRKQYASQQREVLNSRSECTPKYSQMLVHAWWWLPLFSSPGLLDHDVGRPSNVCCSRHYCIRSKSFGHCSSKEVVLHNHSRGPCCGNSGFPSLADRTPTRRVRRLYAVGRVGSRESRGESRTSWTPSLTPVNFLSGFCPGSGCCARRLQGLQKSQEHNGSFCHEHAKDSIRDLGLNTERRLSCSLPRYEVCSPASIKTWMSISVPPVVDLMFSTPGRDGSAKVASLVNSLFTRCIHKA